MIKLSIIIPVYNTEQYVSKCIGSCLSQNIEQDNYEIIVVNDGSTDNSLNIIRYLCYKSSNITVISQQNKKQGAARNNGLGIAKGEYIWFVDSDDWIEPDAVSTILYSLKDFDLDMLRFDAVDHGRKGNMLRSCKHIPNHLYARHEALFEGEFSVCVPFHVFKKSFLQNNGMLFLENIFYEDNEFMLRAFEKACSFRYLNKHLYNVFIREDSTTRSAVCSRKLDIVKVIESQIKYLTSNMLKPEIKHIFGIHIARNMNSLLSGTAQSRVVFNEAVKALCNVEDLGIYIKSSKLSFHIIEFYLLNYPFILRKLLLQVYAN